MVERVTIGHDGEAVSQTMINTGGVASSLDYKGSGVIVQDGISTKEVSSPDQLRGDELITIENTEMTVSMARELGLLGKVFDDQLSIGATASAAEATRENTEEASPPPKSEPATEPEKITAALNGAIDEGTMGFDEASAYDLSVSQVSLAGLEVDQAVEMIDQLADGTLTHEDVTADQRQMLATVEADVTRAAEASAMAELGEELYAYLSQAAKVHPGVRDALRTYSIDRATGRSDGVTWTDFAAYIKEQLGQ